MPPAAGTPAAAASASPSAAPRIVGIDVARGLAILGMIVAHAIPRTDDGELLADGRSSILFATLAGVSLGIVTGAERPLVAGTRSPRLTSIVLRALVLFVVGVLLWTLDSGIAIILDYYAFMFLLLTPLLFLRRPVLASIGLVLAVVAPLIAQGAPDAADAGADPLAAFFSTYLLTGYYPALVWLPFLIAGLICIRSDLRRPRTQVWMIGGGAASAVLGYGAAAVLPGVSAAAHSSTTAEVFGSGGVAIAVIGALLAVTGLPRATGAAVRGILWPIAATGSMALTVYTLQIVALAIAARIRDDSGGIEYPGWPLLMGLCVGSIVFASVWRRVIGTGPLERGMNLLTRPARQPRRETAQR